MSKKHIQTLILFLWCTRTCIAESNNSVCTPSSCGSITITYPFRLTTDPANCGHPDSTFSLDCRHNQTAILRLKSRQYLVQAITYSNFSIRVSDPNLDSHNYSSCPLYSSPDKYLYSSYMNSVSPSSSVTFLSCLTPVDNPFYASDPFCGNGSSRAYSYVTARSVSVSELEDVCTYETSMGSAWPVGDEGNYSYSEIHDVISYGVEMSWFRVHCDECYRKNGDCDLDKDGRVRCRYSCYEIASLPPDSFGCKLVYYGLYAIYVGMAIGGIIGLRLLLGIPFLIALVVGKWKTRRSSMQQSEINREISLLRAADFLPINYTRGEIKKMTESFKSKLGNNLFRAKLRTGAFVAIKMLARSSGSEKEFISRVSKLSRINHPNVMRIVGFCIDGKGRAVVYSPLDRKHVSLQEKMDDSPLKYRDILEIALGIASGARCLHEVGIFDIRAEPRNVMLDEEMNPKILSDCGLEKTGRGKTGFIAPEIFYGNVGEITCKADVYGFGMAILEMAGRMKYGNKAGPVYFPYWAYEQLSEGAGLEIVDADEEEVMMLRKTILVGLWCIQIRAGDRPLMSEVVDMLRGGVEKLGMPPMPFQRGMEDSQNYE